MQNIVSFFSSLTDTSKLKYYVYKAGTLLGRFSSPEAAKKYIENLRNSEGIEVYGVNRKGKTLLQLS